MIKEANRSEHPVHFFDFVVLLKLLPNCAIVLSDILINSMDFLGEYLWFSTQNET